MEEGRAALVRRGTEIQSGKRKPILTETSFVPVFERNNLPEQQEQIITNDEKIKENMEDEDLEQYDNNMEIKADYLFEDPDEDLNEYSS